MSFRGKGVFRITRENAVRVTLLTVLGVVGIGRVAIAKVFECETFACFRFITPQNSLRILGNDSYCFPGTPYIFSSVKVSLRVSISTLYHV